MATLTYDMSRFIPRCRRSTWPQCPEIHRLRLLPLSIQFCPTRQRRVAGGWRTTRRTVPRLRNAALVRMRGQHRHGMHCKEKKRVNQAAKRMNRPAGIRKSARAQIFLMCRACNLFET
jgi:hypothetical protein